MAQDDAMVIYFSPAGKIGDAGRRGAWNNPWVS